MKTLVINGSPRRAGDIAALVETLKSGLRGEVSELSVYRAKLSPCVDCRFCHTHPRCAIDDDMREVYADDYDGIIIASPVYYGSLTPPVMAMASRLQIHHTAKHFLGTPIAVRAKRGGVLLAGGGKGNPSEAFRLSRVILRILGAELPEENVITSLNTDALPAKDDNDAMDKARDLGARLTASHL
ncbi:MAG: flavodoxin family protein [Oscillospiraceae bacterium]|jgi:multimeric flavodoxin WrbA|nr:flavodoxin family protein [Oscillospiraceae bacterium]